MGNHVGLPGAFGYGLLVLLLTAALPCKVSFLSTVEAFNVLFVSSLGGIEFYRACLLSPLGRVVAIVFPYSVGLAPSVRVVVPELSRGIAFSFQASFIEPVVDFNG